MVSISWCFGEVVARLCCVIDESVLRDLRALLAEAKQKVPPFLLQLDEISMELLELGGA